MFQSKTCKEHTYNIFQFHRKSVKSTRKSLRSSTHDNRDEMTFVPIGTGRAIPTSGPGKKGVYYLDFSDDYKNCVKTVREIVEKESRLSELEKTEAAWVEEMKVGTGQYFFLDRFQNPHTICLG